MVDNRSAGFYGVGGGFNFKSGDISGTAAKTSDEKNGQGGEYFSQDGSDFENENDNFNETPFVDRSAVLRASLDSLASLNALNIEVKPNLNLDKNKIKNNKQFAIQENEYQAKFEQ